MPIPAIRVFTAKSIARILREGGTSSWRLDRNHARQLPYVVCTRNAHADWVEGPEPHHSAFLVGKIRDVVSTPPTPENNESPENRFLIQFSEYALVNVPNVWVKGDRNPVKYASMEDLGIDPAKLAWEKMPEPGILPHLTGDVADGAPAATALAAERPLTMAEAKRGLALTFNVPPSAIEITIRG